MKATDWSSFALHMVKQLYHIYMSEVFLQCLCSQVSYTHKLQFFTSHIHKFLFLLPCTPDISTHVITQCMLIKVLPLRMTIWWPKHVGMF